MPTPASHPHPPRVAARIAAGHILQTQPLPQKPQLALLVFAVASAVVVAAAAADGWRRRRRGGVAFSWPQPMCHGSRRSSSGNHLVPYQLPWLLTSSSSLPFPFSSSSPSTFVVPWKSLHPRQVHRLLRVLIACRDHHIHIPRREQQTKFRVKPSHCPLLAFGKVSDDLLDLNVRGKSIIAPERLGGAVALSVEAVVLLILLDFFPHFVWWCCCC